MATKRTSQESDDRDLQVASKRRHGNQEQAETVQNLSFLTARSFNATNDIELHLESVFRKVVQEVIPPMFQRYLAPCRGLNLSQQAGTSRGKPLQLCFTNKLPETIFTQSIIKAEGGAAVQVELRDAATQQRIVRDEYSSMKILLCVLKGDFGSNAKEDWTTEQFNAQTVRPRKGKGQLLNGNTTITLKNGVGYIEKRVVFTDNSSWTSSGKFRLGVKMVQSNSIGADIREGRSKPFKVKDHRGEAYKKHDRPSLNDEVWRLKKLGPKRHEQLSLHGIKTVKDLLRLYITNQASLRERLVERVKQLAYNNLEDLKPLGPDLPQFDFPIAQQGPVNAYTTSFNLLAAGQLETWSSTTTSQSNLVVVGSDQLPALGEMPPNWFAGGQLTSGAYTDYGVPQIDPFASSLFSPDQWEQWNVNHFPFGYDDGAGSSNHSSFPNSDVCTSSKGKRTVWLKIRTAVRWFMLHVARKKAQLLNCQR